MELYQDRYYVCNKDAFWQFVFIFIFSEKYKLVYHKIMTIN